MTLNVYPEEYASEDQALAMRLLGSRPLDDFLSRNWLEAACVSRWEGAPGELCSWRDLLELYARGWNGKSVRRDETTDHREEGLRAGPRVAEGLGVLDGRTLCLEKVQRGVPRLEQLSRGVKLLFGLSGEVIVNAYLSGDSQGFAWHFDAGDVFIVQLEGEKEWHFGTAPALRHPLGNCLEAELPAYRRRFPWAEPQLPHESSLESVRLTPGHVLYLPAGTWHRTAASGLSVALTVTCTRAAFSRALTQLLEEHWEREPDWRRLPCGVHGLSEVRAYFRDRLDELRTWAKGLDVEDLLHAWLSGLAEVTPEERGPHPTEEVRAYRRTAAPVWPVARQQEMLLFAPGRKTKVPRDAWSCLQPLLQRERMTTEDLRSLEPSLDESSARALLTTLVRLGALEPMPATVAGEER